MKIKSFHGIDRLIEEALKIRFKVFVLEQQVPEELEKDDIDAQATHVLLLENGFGFATGRIFADNQNANICRLGRVAVLKEFRGNGWGRTICKILIKLAEEQGFEKILIHAQTKVESFYGKLGFSRFGNEFFEAGIEHIEMEKILFRREANR